VNLLVNHSHTTIVSDDPLGSMRLTPRKDARMDAQQLTEALRQPTAQELLTDAPPPRLAYNAQDSRPLPARRRRD
jgi:hypothetical protein